MNGRQRVRAAIARRPVDRVPLGLYAVDHDTVARVIGRPTVVRNQLAMQLALWDGRRDEMVQQWKADLTDFYRALDCVDIITCRDAMLMPPHDGLVSPLMPPPMPDPSAPPRAIAENTWEDAKGRVFLAIPEVNEIKCVHDPVTATECVLDAADFAGPIPDPSPPPAEVFEVFDHIARTFGNERYILGFSGGCVGISLPGGFERGLMLYALQPEVITAMHRRAVLEQTARDPFWIRPGADGAPFDQDMAGTTAPFISPAMFRELCLPHMTERVAAIKQHIPQVVMHNCGCNLPLMDQFIAAGFDCYQSLQTTAGMDIGMLKKRFGNRMAFWGGVPLETLIAGTVDETRKAVRTTLELAGDDCAITVIGGFEGALDNTAAMRGTDRALLDLLEHPDCVRALGRRFLDDFNAHYYGPLLGMLGANPRGVSLWDMVLMTDGPAHCIQSDFSCMISPDMFGDLGLWYVQEQARTFANTVYHLDGANALHHLPALLEIDDLDCVQFIYQIPDGWSLLDAAPAVRRILEAGKRAEVFAWKLDDVIPFLEHVPPGGLKLNAWTPDRAAAEALCRDIRSLGYPA